MTALEKFYFFDLGRAIWKSASGDRLTHSTPAGLAPIGMDAYESALEREAKPTPEFILVNGKPYVTGERTSQYALLQRNGTANRYKREIFGVAAIASLMYYGFEDYADVRFVVSYPPADADYRREMKDSLLGEWYVESYGKSAYVNVTHVYSETEPLCLIRHLELPDEDGQYHQVAGQDGSWEYFDDKLVLVGDGGGETFDTIGTDIRGNLNTAVMGSRPIGLNHARIRFEQAIRNRHKSFFKGVSDLNPLLIAEAFTTGVLNAGGEQLDCGLEARAERTAYINRVVEYMEAKSGGFKNYRTIILGGGAAGALNGELLNAIDHRNIIYADPNLDQIHLAGVRGLRQLAHKWLEVGALKL